MLSDIWNELPRELGIQLIGSLSTPTSYVAKRNWEDFKQSVSKHLESQLREIYLCDYGRARNELKEEIVKVMARASVRPGKPVSYEAIEAIIAQLTQINLKSYHSAGAIGTISTGSTSAREMINMSKVRSQELITTHFKNRKMSMKDIMFKRQDMVEIMLGDIVTDSEMFLLPNPQGTKEEQEAGFQRPWWHQIYIQGDRAKYDVFAAQSRWMTRLTVNVTDCYRYRIKMLDIVKSLQQNSCFYVMGGPLAEGIIDVVVNEQQALNEMQITSKYLQEGKNKSASTCGITGSSRRTACAPGAREGKSVSKRKMTEARKAALRDIDKFWIPGKRGDTGAIQVYHDIELNEVLGDFRVKGIPNVNSLEPVKISYWSIVTRVQSSARRLLSLYEISFDNILQRVLPIHQEDVFERLEMQGIYNLNQQPAQPLLAVLGKELWSDIWKPTYISEQVWRVQVGPSIFALNKVMKVLGIDRQRPDEQSADAAGNIITTVYMNADPVTATQDWAQKKFDKNLDLRSSIAVDVVKRRYELLSDDIKFYSYAMIKLRMRKKNDYENVTNLCESIYGIWRRRDINAKYTYSNNIWRTYHTLGNYMSRTWYVQELNELVMASGGTADPAHVIFMGDFMSSTGVPLPFSYSGSRKHNPNTLSMMSQQRPLTQILLAAARGLNVPTTTSVSGSIYVGLPAQLGPGLVGENYNPEYKEYIRKLRAEDIKAEQTAVSSRADMYEEEEGAISSEQYTNEVPDYSLLNQVNIQIQTSLPSFIPNI